MTPTPPKIFLSAGEASGDHYGAEILKQLHSVLSNFTAFGLGGTEMEAAGQQRIVRAEDVAVMGITEVVRHMPRIYGEYRKLVESIRHERPDVAVLIDFPDVNLRLAEKLHQKGVPVIYFVSPQLWAWKRSRIETVRRFVSKMLVIFPFEESFYRNRGVNAEFVGHPLAEMPLPTISRAEYARAHELHSSRTWVALLPGSRMREVRHNLPVMLEAASRMGPEYEFLLPVASTLATDAIREKVRQLQPSATFNLHLVEDARAALYQARAAVVASGTATVQAAVVGNPFIAVYRVSGLTYAMAKNMVRYPKEIPATRDAYGNLPVAMANLIAAGVEPGMRVVPELLQENFTAQHVVDQLLPLLADGPERSKMQQQLLRVRSALLPTEPSQTHSLNSIARVCQAIAGQIQSKTISADAASNNAAPETNSTSTR